GGGHALSSGAPQRGDRRRRARRPQLGGRGPGGEPAARPAGAAARADRNEMSIDPSRGLAGLKGALRYVRHYRDQTFVVKLGGDVLRDPDVQRQVAEQIALLHSL